MINNSTIEGRRLVQNMKRSTTTLTLDVWCKEKTVPRETIKTIISYDLPLTSRPTPSVLNKKTKKNKTSVVGYYEEVGSLPSTNDTRTKVQKDVTVLVGVV